MSEIKVKWEFFFDRCVTPMRGAVMVSDDATDLEIDEIVHDCVSGAIASRISWEREPAAAAEKETK